MRVSSIAVGRMVTAPRELLGSQQVENADRLVTMRARTAWTDAPGPGVAVLAPLNPQQPGLAGRALVDDLGSGLGLRWSRRDDRSAAPGRGPAGVRAVPAPPIDHPVG